jgi:hypothetical protein
MKDLATDQEIDIEAAVLPRKYLSCTTLPS